MSGAPIPSHWFLLAAKNLMDRNYAEPLAISDLAAAAFSSPAHFVRRFKANFGETPHRYLQRRIERAKQEGIMRLSHVSIYVLDQDEAKEIYTKKLGMEARNDQVLDGFRGPVPPGTDRPYGIEATFRDNSGNWFSRTQASRQD